MWTNKSLPPHIHAVNTSEMTRKQWENFRSSLTTLGGSDVGTCIGLNRWKSNVELFYEKLGLYNKGDFDSIPMMMGRELEHNIRTLFKYYDVENPKEFLDNYRNKKEVNMVRQRHATFFNDKIPEIHANIDGIVRLKNRDKNDYGVLEIKYQSGQAVRLWENGINPSYLVQLTAYMQLLELDYGVLCIIVDSNQWNVHVIERNDEFWNNIYPSIQEFHECIMTAKEALSDFKSDDEKINEAYIYEPETLFKDQSKPYESFLSEYAKRREKELVIEGDEIMYEMALEVERLNDIAKEAENESRDAKNRLKKAILNMGASVINFGERGSVTYRTQLRLNLKK